MRADRRALLDDDDVEVGVDLLEADRRGEPGGARADDHDVEIHRLAGGNLIPALVMAVFDPCAPRILLENCLEPRLRAATKPANVTDNRTR